MRFSVKLWTSVVEFCEHDHEISGSRESREFDHQLVNEETVQWSWSACRLIIETS
jgi:hypothetical protein